VILIAKKAVTTKSITGGRIPGLFRKELLGQAAFPYGMKNKFAAFCKETYLALTAHFAKG